MMNDAAKQAFQQLSATTVALIQDLHKSGLDIDAIPVERLVDANEHAMKAGAALRGVRSFPMRPAYELVFQLNRPNLCVEVRDYGEHFNDDPDRAARYSIWWTDGPRTDEEFHDDLAYALDNVMDSVADAAYDIREEAATS